jgi:protein-ribulosamine 3-kinase
MPDWTQIITEIRADSGTKAKPDKRVLLSGAGFDQIYRLAAQPMDIFLKLGDVASLDRFISEASGLDALARCAAVRLPRVLSFGTAGREAYLALEYIALYPASPDTDAAFGAQLAALHSHQGEQHGWEYDNSIGTSPQRNRWARDWSEFWTRHRLGFQLELAASHGHDGNLQHLGAALLDRVDDLLDGHHPTPSLLHGDLWSGNRAADAQGRPVIYDPACYYGDRETDIAMTRLFGGFHPRFYRQYEERLPLDPGFEIRSQLYNLYHVLNHLNLFGAAYLGQAEQMLRRLL